MARKVSRNSNMSAGSGMRLSPWAASHALGLMFVIILIFYAIMTWFGGYNSEAFLSQYPVSFSFYSWTLFIGIIESYVFGYLVGWIFASLYNRSSRR